MLLVDDDDPDVGQRRADGQPRPDDDVDVAAPDAPPLVGPLAVAQPGVDERDPGVEVRPQPVDERQGEGDLRDEDEGRPARLQRGGDGLDVDGRLAAAGHAIEQQRPRVARRDGRRPRRRRPAACGSVRAAGGGPATATPGGSGGQRLARSLADLGLEQAAPDEAGDGAPSRGAAPRSAAGQPSTSPPAGAELGQERDLARPERSTGRPLARRQSGGGRARPSSVRWTQRS